MLPATACELYDLPQRNRNPGSGGGTRGMRTALRRPGGFF